MGGRPAELVAVVASAKARSVDVRMVLRINGRVPNDSIADVFVGPGENLGIPDGQNVGACPGADDLVWFLTDDVELRDDVFSPATEPRRRRSTHNRV